VLEDDVRPTPSFFPYCDAMLERYADDERVMHVDGSNRVGQWRPEGCDHHFARHGAVWGWATWARAWARYDMSRERYRTPSARAAIAERALDPVHGAFLAWLLDTDLEALADAWDHQWMLARYATGGLSVVPARNHTLWSKPGTRTARMPEPGAVNTHHTFRPAPRPNRSTVPIADRR